MKRKTLSWWLFYPLAITLKVLPYEPTTDRKASVIKETTVVLIRTDHLADQPDCTNFYRSKHSHFKRDSAGNESILRNCSAPASLSWNFPCIHPSTFRGRFSQQRGLKKLHFYSWPQLKPYTYTQLPACRPLLPLALSLWIKSWEPNSRWFLKSFCQACSSLYAPDSPLGKHRKRRRGRAGERDADRWHSRWDSLPHVGKGYKDTEWKTR